MQGQNDELFIHNARIRRNIVANTWVHGSTDMDNIIFGMFVRGVVDVTIEENEVRLDGQIPFAAMMFKGKIEQGLRETMTKALAATTPPPTETV